jgi:hypothetical protein
MEGVIDVEQSISRRGYVEYANLDDFWVMDQLFGIIHMEREIDRALSTSKGQVDESVRRQVADLNSRIEHFDKLLDSCESRKPLAARSRAS